MKKISIAMLSLCMYAHSNPKANFEAEKSWERCILSIGKESTTVSSAFSYTEKSLLTQHFNLIVPVVLSDENAKNATKAANLIKAKIEVDGKIIKPFQITFTDNKLLPKGTTVAQCHFSIDRSPNKNYTIVATYEQPTINDTTYYIPKFENEVNPEAYNAFSVGALPVDDGLLQLESNHKRKVVAFATRITIWPFPNEIIAIKYSKSEQAASRNH